MEAERGSLVGPPLPAGGWPSSPWGSAPLCSQPQGPPGGANPTTTLPPHVPYSSPCGLTAEPRFSHAWGGPAE